MSESTGPAGVQESAAALPATPPVTQARSLLAETTALMALSVLSPIAGLMVEMALAWGFGTSAVVDAYRVSVLVVVFGQQVFVTSILPFVIVPIFSQYRAEGKEHEAWVVADSLARLLLIAGTIIAVFLFIFPGLATTALAPGLTAEGRAATIFFMRWCGLAFIPMCWSGVACGIMYAYQVFTVAPLAQFLSNVILFAAVLAGSAIFGAKSVVAGVVLGTGVSAGIYFARLARVKRQVGEAARTRGIDFGALKKVLRLAAPLLGGVLVGQTSGAVVARALSRLTAGSLAAFGYAWKLSQIVLLAPNSLTTVLFPRLADSWHTGSQTDFRDGYLRALRAMFFIAVPLTAVAYALREPLVSILLERGAFSTDSSQITTALFGLLVLGAPGTVAGTYVDRMFYATQETVLPVVVDVVFAVLAVLLVPPAAVHYGVEGVAFAYLLIPWLTCFALLVVFQFKHGGFPLKELGGFTLQTTAVGVIAAWMGGEISIAVGGHADAGRLSQMIRLAVGAVSAGLIFLGATSLMDMPEAATCRLSVRRCFVFAQSRMAQAWR